MIGRVLVLVRSLLDVRAWAHLLRVVHFYRYSHVEPVAAAAIGDGVRISPLASFRNGQRVTIGAHSRIGERCCIWAGDTSGRIVIGDHALFGPEVFVTASNYGTEQGTPPMHQQRLEQDVHIGSGVWLGARVFVLPGVTVGDGCIVGAGSVVTSDLPADSIAVGVPAVVVGHRSAAA